MTAYLPYVIALQLILVAFEFRVKSTGGFLAEILAVVAVLRDEDEASGRDGTWRYLEYRRVTFNRVLFTPWLSLHPANYWDDLDFLKSDLNESDGNTGQAAG